MSLYALQKAIYEMNRSTQVLQKYRDDPAAFSAEYSLTEEEQGALTEPDIGLLYVLGVNGQLLMHFAAACGYEWDSYIAAMKAGLVAHGAVREGIYAAREMSR